MCSIVNYIAHLDLQVFNHLVRQFKFMIRNEPETTISDTGGRVKHVFKAFGAVAILCVEMKFKIGTDKEHLEAVAQVIAECDGMLRAIPPLTSLNIQVVTLITRHRSFPYQSTASYLMG